MTLLYDIVNDDLLWPSLWANEEESMTEGEVIWGEE